MELTQRFIYVLSMHLAYEEVCKLRVLLSDKDQWLQRWATIRKGSWGSFVLSPDGKVREGAGRAVASAPPESGQRSSHDLHSEEFDKETEREEQCVCGWVCCKSGGMATGKGSFGKLQTFWSKSNLTRKPILSSVDKRQSSGSSINPTSTEVQGQCCGQINMLLTF